ncbi:MAG: DJ-1/PfpI family protein [Candidatus Peribacteraceae bacterium]|jgi:protease I|nr:thiamine biosynthesis protein ThiJ [bacterium]MDP6561768.1 DJ-1/PfpI family protein [Candidatus Peribacteraceae bacterium]|tara:strand:- start:4841 stop:5356 length:516 start_codon:yes stop_codon:yes gene_type:complete
MPKALIIIAQEGYQDKEYQGTRDGLEDAGNIIIIASKEVGSCSGSLGGSQEATVALKDVQVSDYDRIAFIGGPGAGALASNADALKIANDAYRANMPLGAICIAPTILAKAQVLDGKRATVWNGDGKQSEVLETYGAEYTGEAVTIDGNIVTGNGPGAAEEFGKTLAELKI